MILTREIICNRLEERSAVIWDETGECLIVDPGCINDGEFAALDGLILKNALKPVAVLLTHGHFDHVLGLARCVRKYGVRVYMHPGDKIILEKNRIFCAAFGIENVDMDGVITTDITAGEKLHFGNTDFEVLHTPGHTPGSVCYLFLKDRLLVSGDTLFAGSIGRSDLPYGDYDKLFASALSLMELDGDIDVMPGHGPCTTIADERARNPFLKPFNEPEEEN